MNRAVTAMVVDTETTGMTAEDKLVEFGGLVIEVHPTVGGGLPTTDKIDFRRGHSEIINPHIEIPIEPMAVHHITDALAAKGMDAGAAVCEVMKQSDIVTPDILVAHNADFDRMFLDVFFPDQDWICTYKVALFLYPESPSHKNSVLFYYLGLHRLKDGIDENWFAANMLHRALPDATITAYVFREMLLKLSIEDMISISNKPARLPKCNFGKKHYGAEWADVPKKYLEWMVENITDKEEVRYSAECEIIRRSREDVALLHLAT